MSAYTSSSQVSNASARPDTLERIFSCRFGDIQVGDEICFRNAGSNVVVEDVTAMSSSRIKLIARDGTWTQIGNDDDTMLVRRKETKPAPICMSELTTESLWSEIARRGASKELFGAIEALYTQLDNIGVLASDSHLTAYLTFRVRYQSALASGRPNATDQAEYWRKRIDELDRSE